MTELTCTYGDHRDEALVAFLYDDGDSAERGRFQTHLVTCARCQAEVAGLRGVRTQLARWAPPEPTFALTNPQSNPPPATRNPQWWAAVPAWAQVAAALLFISACAGIANLEVRYDRNGLIVRTGWSGRSGGSDGSGQAGGSDAAGGARRTGGSSGPEVAQGFSPASAPWKADIAALESQLTRQISAARTAAPVAAAPQTVRTLTVADADVTRRVRALVEESEKRQRRELALRVAELLRDVNAQRQADLVKIDRTIGFVQNNVGIEVQKTRNQMDLVLRASQRQ